MKAFLFDMDGLLVDTESLGTSIAVDICKDLGIVLTDKEKVDFVGVTDEKFYRDLFKSRNVSFDVKEVLRDDFSIYEKELEKGVIAFPGAKSLPKKLKDLGFKLGLVSGSTKKQISIILKHLGIENIFDVIISCEDIKHSKPHPESYLLASKKLGVKPSDCVVFEDAKTGISAGKSAGMVVVAVINAGGQDTSQADYVIKSLDKFDYKLLT